MTADLQTRHPNFQRPWFAARRGRRAARLSVTRDAALLTVRFAGAPEPAVKAGQNVASVVADEALRLAGPDASPDALRGAAMSALEGVRKELELSRRHALTELAARNGDLLRQIAEALSGLNELESVAAELIAGGACSRQ
jgi:hypothetical protein